MERNMRKVEIIRKGILKVILLRRLEHSRVSAKVNAENRQDVLKIKSGRTENECGAKVKSQGKKQLK